MKNIPTSIHDTENRVVNLRPDEASPGTMVAVGYPAEIDLPGWLSPVRSINVSDAGGNPCMHLLCHTSDGGPAIMARVGGEGTVSFPSAVRDLIPLGENRFLGISASGNMPVIYDPDEDAYKALPPASELPPIVFGSFMVGQLSATVAGRTLSGNYSTATQLGEADARAVGNDVSDAYMRIVEAADAGAAMMQPVILRYRLLDRRGQTLYVSPFVMLSSADAGLQAQVTAIAPLSTDDKSRSVVGEYTLRMQSYRINAFIPAALADIWKGYAHSYVVEVSPQIDPVDISMKPAIYMNPRTSAQRTLTLCLPGADSASILFSNAVPACIDNFDSYCQVLHSGLLSEIDPVSGSAVYNLSCGNAVSPSARYGLIRTIISGRKPTDTVLTSLQLPHSVVADDMVLSGNAALWHGLAPVRFYGYTPLHYACGDPVSASSASRFAAAVDFADGSRTVVSAVRTGDTHPYMNPLICYPRADAVRITMICLVDGECRRYEFPLTPTPCRKAAYWLRPSGQALPFASEGSAGGSFHVPASEVAEEKLPSYCCVSPAANLLKITSALPVGTGSVRAACECASASSIVDSPRFAVFTDEGIHRLTISADASDPQIRSSRRIDRRTVVSSSALCCHGGTVYAVAGNELVSLTGTRIRTLARGFTSDSLNPPSVGMTGRGELWISSGGLLAIYLPDSGGFCFRQLNFGKIPRFGRMVSAGGSLYASDISDGGRLYDLSRETDAPVDVEWTEVRTLARPGSRRVRLRGIELGMRAMNASGSVDVLGDVCAGPHDALMPQHRAAKLSPLASLRIGGTVSSPVFIPVVAPPLRSIRLRVRMCLNPGARLQYIEPCV